MTNLELEEILKSKNKFSNVTNRVFAIIIILLGLIFLPIIINKGVSSNSDNVIITWIGILALPIMPIIIGMLVLYWIPKQYNVTVIRSNEAIHIKHKKIINSLANYKVKSITETNDIKAISCMNKFYNGFNIFLFVDNEKYLFNVQSHDICAAKGVFDLGLSKRITNRIKASLQQPV
jgi:hypothetical protein